MCHGYAKLMITYLLGFLFEERKEEVALANPTFSSNLPKTAAGRKNQRQDPPRVEITHL